MSTKSDWFVFITISVVCFISIVGWTYNSNRVYELEEANKKLIEENNYIKRNYDSLYEEYTDYRIEVTGTDDWL